MLSLFLVFVLTSIFNITANAVTMFMTPYYMQKVGNDRDHDSAHHYNNFGPTVTAMDTEEELPPCGCRECLNKGHMVMNDNDGEVPEDRMSGLEEPLPEPELMSTPENSGDEKMTPVGFNLQPNPNNPYPTLLSRQFEYDSNCSGTTDSKVTTKANSDSKRVTTSTQTEKTSEESENYTPTLSLFDALGTEQPTSMPQALTPGLILPSQSLSENFSTVTNNYITNDFIHNYHSALVPVMSMIPGPNIPVTQVPYITNTGYEPGHSEIYHQSQSDPSLMNSQIGFQGASGGQDNVMMATLYNPLTGELGPQIPISMPQPNMATTVVGSNTNSSTDINSPDLLSVQEIAEDEKTILDYYYEHIEFDQTNITDSKLQNLNYIAHGRFLAEKLNSANFTRVSYLMDRFRTTNFASGEMITYLESRIKRLRPISERVAVQGKDFDDLNIPEFEFSLGYCDFKNTDEGKFLQEMVYRAVQDNIIMQVLDVREKPNSNLGNSKEGQNSNSINVGSLVDVTSLTSTYDFKSLRKAYEVDFHAGDYDHSDSQLSNRMLVFDYVMKPRLLFDYWESLVGKDSESPGQNSGVLSNDQMNMLKRRYRKVYTKYRDIRMRLNKKIGAANSSDSNLRITRQMKEAMKLYSDSTDTVLVNQDLSEPRSFEKSMLSESINGKSQSKPSEPTPAKPDKKEVKISLHPDGHQKSQSSMVNRGGKKEPASNVTYIDRIDAKNLNPDRNSNRNLKLIVAQKKSGNNDLNSSNSNTSRSDGKITLAEANSKPESDKLKDDGNIDTGSGSVLSSQVTAPESSGVTQVTINDDKLKNMTIKEFNNAINSKDPEVVLSNKSGFIKLGTQERDHLLAHLYKVDKHNKRMYENGDGGTSSSKQGQTSNKYHSTSNVNDLTFISYRQVIDDLNKRIGLIMAQKQIDNKYNNVNAIALEGIKKWYEEAVRRHLVLKRMEKEKKMKQDIEAKKTYNDIKVSDNQDTKILVDEKTNQDSTDNEPSTPTMLTTAAGQDKYPTLITSLGKTATTMTKKSQEVEDKVPAMTKSQIEKDSKIAEEIQKGAIKEEEEKYNDHFPVLFGRLSKKSISDRKPSLVAANSKTGKGGSGSVWSKFDK